MGIHFRLGPDEPGFIIGGIHCRLRPVKSMLREFAKASKAEIWTRVRRRHLTYSAGLSFENEPGLTELDAAEGRRIGLDCPGGICKWSWARRQTAYARFYHHEGIMISTLFASSKFVTNRNHFQVIAETEPTGQLHYDGIANGGHLFRPEDKDELGARSLGSLMGYIRIY